jgi:hypothetical protein
MRRKAAQSCSGNSGRQADDSFGTRKHTNWYHLCHCNGNAMAADE